MEAAVELIERLVSVSSIDVHRKSLGANPSIRFKKVRKTSSR